MGEFDFPFVLSSRLELISALSLPSAQIDHENVTAVLMAYYPGQESVSQALHVFSIHDPS